MKFEEQVTKLKNELIEAINSTVINGREITRIDLFFDNFRQSDGSTAILLYISSPKNGDPGAHTEDDFVKAIYIKDWGERGFFKKNIETLHFKALGKFLIKMLQNLRDEGHFDKFKSNQKCYLGVSTFQGEFGWPHYKKIGKVDDLI